MLRKVFCQLPVAGILVLALTSSVDAAETKNSPPPLQQLVNDAVAQFQLAYRFHPEVRQARYHKLAEAVDSWREAPRSKANDRLLAEWLRKAIRTSMPGSRAALPEQPDFSGLRARPSAGNPFLDDPFIDDPS